MEELMRQYRVSLDKDLQGVMPDHWPGHGRLIVRRAEDLSTEQRKFGVRLVEKLIEKKDKPDAEQVGQLAVEKAREKF